VITVSVSPTSVKEFGMTNGDLRVLPNPTNGIITISSRFEMQKIEVINIPGQILLSETVNDKSFQIQLQDFSAGIYFVRIIYPNGLSIVKKVIVNH
jgi:hypothetical protein